MELYCQSLKPAPHATEVVQTTFLDLAQRPRDSINREGGIDAGTQLARRGLCSRRGTRDQVYQSFSALLAIWDVEGSDCSSGRRVMSLEGYGSLSRPSGWTFRRFVLVGFFCVVMDVS